MAIIWEDKEECCTSDGSVVNVLPGNNNIKGCLLYSNIQVNKALGTITFEGSQRVQDYVQAMKGPYEYAQGQG